MLGYIEGIINVSNHAKTLSPFLHGRFVFIVTMALQELDVGKVKKGNNFVVNDKKQLCRYVFHMLQDPIARNGQKNHSFWG
jgi:hypothetical protein